MRHREHGSKIWSPIAPRHADTMTRRHCVSFSKSATTHRQFIHVLLFLDCHSNTEHSADKPVLDIPYHVEIQDRASSAKSTVVSICMCN